MDYELIFWCVAGVAGLVFLALVMLTPKDEPVSQETLRRLRGERTH